MQPGPFVWKARTPLRHRANFPFSAVVGQDAMKTALLLNAVDPRIGGLLIRGQKGTAKSTAVRALVDVLPEIAVVDGCAYACDPFDRSRWCDDCRVRAEAGRPPKTRRRPFVVDLPVSATEDRLVGALDMEHALRHGERRFEPGLLAAANRGVLYVDEVNLLDDHLVDTLLDVAAMGVNTVEREGVGVSHPSRFILVGTMNPEEGEVRPQLLDRFGLCCEVEGLSDPDDRVEVIRRRGAYENDPESFTAAWRDEQIALEERLARAQGALGDVVLGDGIVRLIASVCAELRVDGHRADLTMARSAAALAALRGASETAVSHVREVAPLVLAHRMRRGPFEQMTFDEELLERALAAETTVEDAVPRGDPDPGDARDDDAAAPESVAVGEPVTGEASDAPVTGLTTPLDRARRNGNGRRQESRSDDRRGRFTRTAPLEKDGTPDVALEATLRGAALRGGAGDGGLAIQVEPEDIRNKLRTRRVGSSIVFCVDASGSMGATSRMDAAKSAILDLLVDAYQRRDRVGLVSFRGNGAEVLLDPTTSVELAQIRLRSLPTGGATPLAHGIRTSLEVLARERRRHRDAVPWLVLVTDGRANVGLDGGRGSEDARRWAERAKSAAVNTMVLDTDSGASPITVARELARLADGQYVRLARLDGRTLAGAVRERVGAERASGVGL